MPTMKLDERRPTVMGVDPGFGGGLAAVTLDGEVVAVAPMPVLRGKKTEIDVPGLVGLVRAIEVAHAIKLVVVESVHSMPKQGVASSFNFGRNFGEVLGAVKALGLPVEMPLPQAWKKVVLAGTAGDKLAAVQYATRRFPSASLLATPRSRKPHDGIADGLCLAEWGRRLLLGAGGSRTDHQAPLPSPSR
jgi:crossover junction endodeoxyribonuclease RuvC